MTLSTSGLTVFARGSERWRLLRATIKTIQPHLRSALGKVEATLQNDPCTPVESHTLSRLWESLLGRVTLTEKTEFVRGTFHVDDY
jgi:hypothetical protein